MFRLLSDVANTSGQSITGTTMQDATGYVIPFQGNHTVPFKFLVPLSISNPLSGLKWDMTMGTVTNEVITVNGGIFPTPDCDINGFTGQSNSLPTLLNNHLWVEIKGYIKFTTGGQDAQLRFGRVANLGTTNILTSGLVEYGEV